MKAYPFIHKDPTSGLTRMEEGMDLRDWFAGLAMQALLHQGSNVYDLMAQRAYRIADEMMAARTRKDVPNETN
jgi:hypothetical protein